MSILNRFKKGNVDKNKKEEVKETVNTTNTTKSDELTTEYCQGLLKRIYTDKDHGDSMMNEVSLRDNIFILGYIANSIIPAVEKESNENNKIFFKTTMSLFKKIFYDKLKKCDKLWKIVSKTTGYPFVENGFAHVLICNDNNDHMIEQLKKYYYDVEIVEVQSKDFKNELKELCRNGYEGIMFSDGIVRPYAMTLGNFIGAKDFEDPNMIINPMTQKAMIAFFQEVRRNINYEGAEQIRRNLENMMIYYIINTKFIVPFKKVSEDRYDSPIYMPKDNEKCEPGLYVFTDKVEMKSLEKRGIKESDGWEARVFDFTQVINMVEGQHLSEICINFDSTCFRLNRKSLDVLKEEAEKVLKKANDEKSREIWESTELPKVLKDKSVPSIKDSMGKVLFRREKDSFAMSTYVLNIISKNNHVEDIYEFLFNDGEMEEISFYDIEDKSINLNLKEGNDKKGTFIMPMRYDDELDTEPVNDDTMHYTKDACRVKFSNENSENIDTYDKTMHFFTIVNKDTSENYIPIFTDEKEIEGIFPRDKYRYCTVSYEDAFLQAKPYEGIVVNPLSMSILLKNKYLSKVTDIEIK